MLQKEQESNPEKVEFIMKKGQNTAIINGEKGNGIVAHAGQIRPQDEYEEQNEEESLRFLPLMIYWNNIYRMRLKTQMKIKRP